VKEFGALHFVLQDCKARKAAISCAFCLANPLRDVTLGAMRVPHTVRTVADVIGLEAAVRLSGAAYANRQVYVPAGVVKPDHRLARVLAPDELRKLQRHFGGELLPFPTLRRAKRQRMTERKAKAIRADIKAGLPSVEIARKHKVSDKYVYRIRATGETSSSQAYPRKRER
jgi:hypothetical protein